MLPELSEIKSKRKELDLTQNDLSELSKVSQSLIAKIENKQVIPSYDNAKKLFDVLFGNEKELTAKELMSKKIVSIDSEKTLLNVIELMEKKSVSQLPVIESGKSIGSITERNAFDLIQESIKPEKILEKKVKTVMDKPFPELSINSGIERISNALRNSPAVLIINENKVTGIISKSDLMKRITGRK
ncbi:MAG: CBS domain-containing protein [Candidatus Diapherotrites archaeon]